MAVNPYLPAVLTDPPHWTLRAACRGMSGPAADPWYPDVKGEEGRRITETAKAVCRQCPVARECATQALATGEEWGTWGGLTTRERRKITKQARRSAPRRRREQGRRR